MFDKLKQGLKGIVDRISKSGLTEKDLDPIIWDLQLQLISNDVSVEVAERVCDELKERLLGEEAARFGDRSQLVRDALRESIEVVLETGEQVEGTFAEFKLLVREGDMLIPKIRCDPPLKTECDHFVECLLEDRRPFTDGENGLAVVRALEAAGRSIENRGQNILVEKEK